MCIASVMQLRYSYIQLKKLGTDSVSREFEIALQIWKLKIAK
jgi:hypothetical protein